jgi:hypothetical protein
MRIGLVGCVKQKALVTAPAAELYASPLFRARRTYVERSCDRWFILSAKHGLLHPDQPTAPYDEALTKVIRAARRAWSAKVVRQLEQALPTLDGETFEIHAGSAYRDNGLLDALHLAGATVVVPTEGLSLGRQLAWYAATVGSSRPATGARWRRPAHQVASWSSAAGHSDVLRPRADSGSTAPAIGLPTPRLVVQPAGTCGAAMDGRRTARRQG